MNHVIGIALCFAGASAFAQFEDVDPVVRAKAHRAVGDSQDLPPIPRGLTEPPPLPPPELHTHDIRRHRRGAAQPRKAQRGKRPAVQKKAQQAKAPAAKKAASAKKQLAGPPRRS